MAKKIQTNNRTQIHLQLTLLVSLSSAFVLSGCSGSDDTNEVPDTGVLANSDTGVHPDAAPIYPDAAEPIMDAGMAPDTGPVTDDNDSFAEAREININGKLSGAINPAGDIDYFSFEGTEGDWIAITTERLRSNQPSNLDTVVTLYDSSMEQLARNDDDIAGIDSDSEIIYHVAATGTYFLKVEDFSTTRDDRENEGGAGFRYSVKVDRFVTENNDFVTVDAERGNDAASANDFSFFTGGSRPVGYALGTLTDPADVDVYRFTIPPGAANNFRIQVMPAGPSGYGSTSGLGDMWVTNVSGSTITARISNADQTLFRLSPSLPGGDYLLWLAHPGDAAGANDHYVVKNFIFNENPAEMLEERNNTEAGAEEIPLSETSRAGYIISALPDGDTDHYKINLQPNEKVSVFCGSRTAGSGIVDVTASVRDQSGTTIATGTESATISIALRDLVVTSSVAYIQLDRGPQLMDVTGDWVRCGIRAEMD